MESNRKIVGWAFFAAALASILFYAVQTPRRSVGLRARRSTSVTFEPTPARLERGRYLVEAVAHCFHCHSELDPTSPGAPPRAEKKGVGKVVLQQGTTRLVAANITPTAKQVPAVGLTHS